MLVIAECGSTKTDWCIYNPKNGHVDLKKTMGINPYFSKEEDVLACLNTELGVIDTIEISEVHFYGPGCSQNEQKVKLQRWLQSFFIHADIEVETDLLASGRGAFLDESGIVCILGTGSNSGVYKNGQITKTFPSLGYLFGDEGSGAHIGRQLITDFLNDELPPVVKDLFTQKYNIGYKEILDNVYSGTYPNRYLASFTQFVIDNSNFAYCRTLVDYAFDLFFTKRLLRYSGLDTYTVRFVGSVAYSFSDILVKVALRHDVRLDSEKDIIKTPLEGLIKYHFGDFESLSHHDIVG